LKAQGAQIVLMAENELAERMAALALDGYVGLPPRYLPDAASNGIEPAEYGPELNPSDALARKDDNVEPGLPQTA
jgi:hypothetical protein